MKTENRTPEQIFEDQAYFNKWLKELQPHERQHVIDMIAEYHAQFTPPNVREVYVKVDVKDRLPKLNKDRNFNWYHTILDKDGEHAGVFECFEDGFKHSNGEPCEAQFWLELTYLPEIDGEKAKKELPSNNELTAMMQEVVSKMTACEFLGKEQELKMINDNWGTIFHLFKRGYELALSSRPSYNGVSKEEELLQCEDCGKKSTTVKKRSNGYGLQCYDCYKEDMEFDENFK